MLILFFTNSLRRQMPDINLKYLFVIFNKLIILANFYKSVNINFTKQKTVVK